MTETDIAPPKRKRAPSKRSLETRARILDAAERLFAQGGFDGASMRDIAMAADVPVALVNFHGGAKEALFETVVARRAVDGGERVAPLGPLARVGRIGQSV